ncbi:MAG: DUF4382 domain-containing protein [Betaproteobacteria bacterium]|nr:DUF4382 domain-containing protein [Betaproteobacteria bacterium]
MTGCGGGSGSSSGTMGVSLTDAPACGFDAVNVTVRKVRIHQSSVAPDSSDGWTDITLNPARKINLLDLNNGVLESLGETPLTVGHYTQLRLVLAANTGQPIANSIVLSGTTTEIPLATPSAVQSGIKLVNSFDVASGQRTDVVLDFDACKSIVTRGNGMYALKPVIKVIPTSLNGIKGFVDASLLGNQVMVSAEVNGGVVNSTVPDPQTGEFFLARIPPGTYDVVITADDHATAAIAAVPVANDNSIVSISSNAAPVLLPVSASHSISGNVTLNPVSASEEVVFVAAKQTLGSGPTVTVKSQGADLLSGAYSLALPASAPLLGQYGSGTLPIALAAQSAVAGQYAVEASATGYQTQSFSKDISAADATQNFTLVP